MADSKPPAAEAPKVSEPAIEVTEREDTGLLDLDHNTLDPNKTYRWVRADKTRIARAKMRGYRFVDPQSKVQTLVEAERGQGMIQIGDVVLMECPKSRFESRKEAQRNHSQSKLQTTDSEVRSEAKRKGIRVITDKE